MSPSDDETRRARHPVLATRVLRADGTETTGFRVFCSERCETIDLDTCRACEVCDGVVPSGAGADVLCRPRVDVDDARPGEMMTGPLLCVEGDVPASRVTPLFVEHEVDCVLVVDGEGHLCGTIRGVDLVRATSPGFTSEPDTALSRATARVAVERFRSLEARDLMSTPVRIDDSEDLDRAVRKLARAHARELVVLTRDGTPVGVVRDVDLLHAVRRKRQRGA